MITRISKAHNGAKQPRQPHIWEEPLCCNLQIFQRTSFAIVLFLLLFISFQIFRTIWSTRQGCMLFFFFNLRHVKLVFFLFLALEFLQFDLLFLFLAALGLLCVGFLSLGCVEAVLHCGAQASHCSGFPSCGAQALGEWAQ